MRSVVNMPEKDRAMDMGNMHRHVVKNTHVVPEISCWTDRHIDTLISQYFTTASTGEVISAEDLVRGPDISCEGGYKQNIVSGKVLWNEWYLSLEWHSEGVKDGESSQEYGEFTENDTTCARWGESEKWLGRGWWNQMRNRLQKKGDTHQKQRPLIYRLNNFVLKIFTNQNLFTQNALIIY